MNRRKLTEEQKAKILLKNLDEYLQVNWNFEEYYLKAIKNGLREIDQRENKKADQDGRPNQQINYELRRV